MTRRSDILAVVFLFLLPWVYFWQITLQQQVWFGADVVRSYFPLGAELSRALTAGRLPLWTTGMYAGYPILADTVIAALYPINLILFRLLPPHIAISYSMLFHMGWAAIGAYLLARSYRLRPASAVLAGIVFCFNGFMFSRLEHFVVLVASAWLPWTLYFYERLRQALEKKSSAGFWFIGIVFALGAAFLTGFLQFALMNTLTLAIYVIVRPWFEISPQPINLKARVIKSARAVLVLSILGALVLGIVAIQIVPTLELAGLSTRGGQASDYAFVTSLSLPVQYLAQFLSPFFVAAPIEFTNNEFWGYFGIMPLFLAAVAVLLSRDRRLIFWLPYAVLILSIVLGDQNPVNQIILRLPGLNLFRVPARYLAHFVFACALLGAIAFDELASRLARPPTRRKEITLFGVLAIVLTFALWSAHNVLLDTWLSAWRVLPIVLLTLTLGILLLGYNRKIDQAFFQAGVLGLTLFDVTSVAPVFDKILGQPTESAYVSIAPRSLQVLSSEPGAERVLADDSFLPSLASLRNSLQPNMSLVYGKESAASYTSLATTWHSEFMRLLSPGTLNLINVRYYTVPLEPRILQESLSPPETLYANVLNHEVEIPPTVAQAVELFSFTEAAENLSDGTLVGELVIRYDNGHNATFPLRVGMETADWDYARKSPQHRQAQIARSFPGFWRSFGKMFEGHSYISRFTVEPGNIVGMSVVAIHQSARLMVERAALIGLDGQPILLNKLSNRNDFSLAYLSDTVAIWQNHEVMPRAWLAHNAQVVPGDAQLLTQLREPGFPIAKMLLLSEGKAIQAGTPATDAVKLLDYQAERVTLSAMTDQPGYLFLADTWYPGWVAYVDDRPAPIYRADYLFRAVPLEPGTHRVVFEYRPTSFYLGALISGLSLMVVVLLGLVINRSQTIRNWLV